MFLARPSPSFAKLGAKLIGQAAKGISDNVKYYRKKPRRLNTGSEAEVRQNDCKSMNVKRRRSLRSHYVLGRIASTRRLVRFLSQTIMVSATNVLPFQTMSCYFHCLNVTYSGPRYCGGNHIGRKLCCSGSDSDRYVY